MSEIIPILSSCYSIGKSILNCDKPEEIVDNKPVSVFSICKKHNIKDLYLVEKSLTGLIEAYENSKENDINLRFGYKVSICQDILDKSEKSLETESRIIVWLKNSEGYRDLIKISSFANVDGFYYQGRIDYKNLKRLWSDNLMLSIPFYSSFLHNNALKGHRCLPDFGPIKPNIFIANHILPFDPLIEKLHKDYAKENSLEVLNISNVYYYKRQDWPAYCVFRAISERSTFNCPNIDHFGSDRFSFEDYLEKIQ